MHANVPNPPMVRLYDTNPWRLPESPRPLTLEALVHKVTNTPDKYCTCCEFVSRDNGINGMWLVVGPYAVGDPPEVMERWRQMQEGFTGHLWRIRVIHSYGAHRPPMMAPGIVPTGDLFLPFEVPRIAGDPPPHRFLTPPISFRGKQFPRTSFFLSQRSGGDGSAVAGPPTGSAVAEPPGRRAASDGWRSQGSNDTWHGWQPAVPGPMVSHSNAPSTDQGSGQIACLYVSVGEEANVQMVAMDLRNQAPTILFVCCGNEEVANRMATALISPGVDNRPRGDGGKGTGRPGRAGPEDFQVMFHCVRHCELIIAGRSGIVKEVEMKDGLLRAIDSPPML